MAWHDDPNHPFVGIAKKLERANQNIGLLGAEIDSFIGKSDYPILPKPDEKGWREAIDHNFNRRIPVSYAVLAGEIIHHLRSCFDHLVWQFTDDAVRLDPKLQNRIEFPVWVDRTNAKQRTRFKEQTQGVSNPKVRDLIECYQPHLVGADFLDHPLCVIHDFDRFDKHRELQMISSCANVQFPQSLPNAAELGRMLILYKQGKLQASQTTAMHRALYEDVQVVPGVAFPKVGSATTIPVIPLLTRLYDFTWEVVDAFAAEV